MLGKGAPQYLLEVVLPSSEAAGLADFFRRNFSTETFLTRVRVWEPLLPSWPVHRNNPMWEGFQWMTKVEVLMSPQELGEALREVRSYLKRRKGRAADILIRPVQSVHSIGLPLDAPHGEVGAGCFSPQVREQGV
jgi:hypothetical protein